LHIEKLHDMYRSVNAVGRLTERQWDRWDERNALEKLNYTQNFSLKP